VENEKKGSDVNLDHLKIKQLKDKLDYHKRQHSEEIAQIHAHYQYILQQNNVQDPSMDPSSSPQVRPETQPNSLGSTMAENLPQDLSSKLKHNDK